MTKQKMIMAAICFGTIFAISTPCTGLQKILSKAQITACAADSTKGTYGNLSYTNYGTYIKITGCSANATEEKIPAEINGIPVTTIGNYAFSYCDNLTSVIIPNGVTSIGTYAFCWCEKLAAVHIPNTVKTIGSGAFNHCQSLVSAAIPDGVTTLEAEVFSGCEA